MLIEYFLTNALNSAGTTHTISCPLSSFPSSFFFLLIDLLHSRRLSLFGLLQVQSEKYDTMSSSPFQMDMKRNDTPQPWKEMSTFAFSVRPTSLKRHAQKFVIREFCKACARMKLYTGALWSLIGVRLSPACNVQQVHPLCMRSKAENLDSQRSRKWKSAAYMGWSGVQDF